MDLAAHPMALHGFLSHGAADRALTWILTHGVRIVVIMATAFLVSRAARRLLTRFEHRLRTEDVQAGRTPKRSETLAGVSKSVVTMSAWTIATTLALGELGLNLAPLVASASVVGVALGFGAQSLVRDFLTGFFVLLEDQYAIGDVVDLGGVAGPGVMGTVERFTLRMTSLRADDGTLHNVANGSFQRVSNSSAGWATALIDVGVAHEADQQDVGEALDRVSEDLLADEQVSALVLEPPVVLGPQALTESQVTIRVSIKTLPGRRATVARAYRQGVKRVFEHARIPLSTPASMLLVHGGATGSLPQAAGMQEGASPGPETGSAE